MATVAHARSIVFRLIAFLALVTFTVGCTVMQPIHGTDSVLLSNQISIGDTIEIDQKIGESLRFNVNEILPTGIGGQGNFVAYRDIQQVRISQFSRTSPGAAILGVVVVGGAALLKTWVENNAPYLGFPGY